MHRIVFTVTNDLSYDQRMHRICTSLVNAGYEVTLVGRQKRDSIPLSKTPYQQKRLYSFFDKGFGFYAEYNIRLFIYLLSKGMDGVCAIDLDTILPCYWVSRLKRVKRVYDAHELFCEMKEIVSRPKIYRFWKRIEKWMVPRFPFGYTVNQTIADEFSRMYGSQFEVIRSVPLYYPVESSKQKERFILYQGAVNEGRCFEYLIPAMKNVDSQLVICGNGNFMSQAKELTRANNLEDRIQFKGWVPPTELKAITQKAYIGITLFDKAGLSNYYSLANRFFDYIHAALPQICIDYPLYREINNLYPVAVLIKDPTEEQIFQNLNALLRDEDLWNNLSNNCHQAAKELNWQKESQKLISFYKTVIG